MSERQRLLDNYRQLLDCLPVSMLEIPPNVRSSVHLAVIRLHSREPTYHRYVFEGLRAAGIGVQLHYSPVHLQPFYRRYGFAEGDFPEAEAYAQNAISLPLYPGLQDHEQQRVVKALAGLCKLNLTLTCFEDDNQNQLCCIGFLRVLWH